MTSFASSKQQKAHEKIIGQWAPRQRNVKALCVSFGSFCILYHFVNFVVLFEYFSDISLWSLGLFSISAVNMYVLVPTVWTFVSVLLVWVYLCSFWMTFFHQSICFLVIMPSMLTWSRCVCVRVCVVLARMEQTLQRAR